MSTCHTWPMDTPKIRRSSTALAKNGKDWMSPQRQRDVAGVSAGLR